MTKRNQGKVEDKPVPESQGEKVAGQVCAVVAGTALLAPVSPPLARAVVDRIGAPLAGLLWLAEVVFVMAAVAMFWRYVSALKGAVAPTDSAPHQHYLALRDAVLVGGRASQIYSRWLTRLLAAVDHFFGDAGQPASARQRRCFSLTTGAPLWSAPAYDR